MKSKSFISSIMAIAVLSAGVFSYSVSAETNVIDRQLEQPIEYLAEWRPVPFKMTIDTSELNGATAEVFKNGNLVESSFKFQQGDVISLKVNADDGYTFNMSGPDAYIAQDPNSASVELGNTSFHDFMIISDDKFDDKFISWNDLDYSILEMLVRDYIDYDNPPGFLVKIEGNAVVDKGYNPVTLNGLTVSYGGQYDYPLSYTVEVEGKESDDVNNEKAFEAIKRSIYFHYAMRYEEWTELPQEDEYICEISKIGDSYYFTFTFTEEGQKKYIFNGNIISLTGKLDRINVVYLGDIQSSDDNVTDEPPNSDPVVDTTDYNTGKVEKIEVEGGDNMYVLGISSGDASSHNSYTVTVTRSDGKKQTRQIFDCYKGFNYKNNEGQTMVANGTKGTYYIVIKVINADSDWEPISVTIEPTED